MNWTDPSPLQPGQALAELVLPPVSRHTLALYCGGSGDHNPLHVDIDFARGAGFDDVIAHGMLVMAYLGRLLTDQVPPQSIRRLRTRFRAMTRVGDVITCRARVIARTGPDVELALEAVRQDGTVVADGDATLALATP